MQMPIFHEIFCTVFLNEMKDVRISNTQLVLQFKFSKCFPLYFSLAAALCET